MKRNCKRKVLTGISAILTLVLTLLITSAAPPYATLPLSEYPSGSYFTTTGTACVNHNHCKMVNGATQCYGFANYVHYKMFNTYGSSCTRRNRVDEDGNPLRFSSVSAEAEFIKTLSPGTHVRVHRTAKHTGHSFIILSTSNTGVTVYEANMDGKCGVRVYTYTYANLHKNYSYISFTIDNSRHTYTTKKTLISSSSQCYKTTHTCSKCAYNYSDTVTSHSLESDKIKYATATKCCQTYSYCKNCTYRTNIKNYNTHDYGSTQAHSRTCRRCGYVQTITA